MNGKIVALALGLSACFTGPAMAAISPGDGAAGNPPGELFFTVWDAANQVSYTRDLGITVVDLINNPDQLISLPPDSLYTQTFDGIDPATLVYSVGGFNARFGDFPCCYGMVISSNSTQSQLFIPDVTALVTSLAIGGYYAAGVNSDAGDLSNFSANVSALSLPGSSGYYDGDNWGGNIGLSVPFQTGATIGTSVKAYTMLLAEDGSTVNVTALSNHWNLAADGTFSYELADADGDGVGDTIDNCTLVANPDQRDTDADGFGNICDADFNGDCTVDALDLRFMLAVFHTANPRADLNGDGTVNTRDFAAFLPMRGQPPGPTGLPNACSP
jgi:Dockerin type I domain/Thrombospondin type 3 repeat